MEFFAINSLYLWRCAQSPDFNGKADQFLTPSQNAERLQLAEQAYFGWGSDPLQTLDYNLPKIYNKRDSRIRTIILPTPASPTTLLGNLDMLPLEIINEIISSLDISSLDQLKATNRRAFEVVNAHPQFKTINRQAHDVLRGLRAMKTADRITLQALFNKFCASVCYECGDFGGYMYLVTFERLCCRCIRDKDRRLFDKHKYVPLREFDAVMEYGLTLEVLNTLPRFLGYPGYYGRPGGPLRDYVLLVDRDSARDAGIALHGSMQAMQDYTANADPAVLKLYKNEIRRREKKSQAERAECARRKISKEIAYIKEHKAHKREVIRRRTERAKRLGLSEDEFDIMGRNTNPEFLIEDTDNESISRESTPATNIGDESNAEGNGDDSEYFGHQLRFTFDQKPKNAESASGEDSCDEKHEEDFKEVGAESASSEVSWDEEHDGVRHFIRRCEQEDLRYRAMMRVPWLNRQSQVDEWGFRCVGCKDNSGANDREFIMSTFRQHLKEYGPIKDGIHHTHDCCSQRKCRVRDSSRFAGIPGNVPYWRY